MESKEKERVKRILLRHVKNAKQLSVEVTGNARGAFILICVMYELESDKKSPQLLAQLGSYGFRLFRDVVLLNESLGIFPDDAVIRKTVDVVQNVLEAGSIPWLESLDSLETLAKKTSIMVKHWLERAEVLTAALGLPEERSYDVLYHAYRIDPNLLGLPRFFVTSREE